MLINPPAPHILKNKSRRIPIGLLYLGAELKKYGHVVKLIDINNDFLNLEQKSQLNSKTYYSNFDLKIKVLNPDIVGITCQFSGKFKALLEISKRIKKINPNAPIVMGGIHSATFPKEILEQYDCIDYICLSEGENLIIDLINAHFNDKSSLTKIDGIAFRNGKKIIINPKRVFIKNLDEIPFPDYGIINLKDYYFDTSKWFNPKNLPINVNLPILSSRDCPNQCSFCANSIIWRRGWRARSAKNVVDEIEFLYKKYNHRYFSFMDDNFTLSKQRVLDICKEILKRKLDIQFDFPNGVSVKTLDKEVMDNLVKAGMVWLCVAIESGSEYIRNKVIKKNLPTKKIYDFFELAKNYKNLIIKAFFIIGFPQETKETLEETYMMIEKIKDSLDVLGIFYLTPYSGTEIFEYCQKNCLIKTTKKDLCNRDDYYFSDQGREGDKPFIKPFALEIKDLEEFREKVLKLVKRRI